MNISIDHLDTFCMRALKTAGVCDADARTTTDVLVTTDSWGVFTHGTKALRNYIRRVRGGGLRKEGNPTIVQEGPATALVDGGSSIGMVTSVYAMNLAIAKARSAGFGYVGVRNNCHYGAAGYYASLAIPAGMIGLSMANDIPTVNGPGATCAVMGSNPFAFAAPSNRAFPILLDMATSTVAGGKVYAAAALNKPIPDGWIVDNSGNPAADPKLFADHASLTPMAGYKGFGLAVMIEVLSAILTGAAITRQVASWSFSDPATTTGHGACFIALNIEAFMPLPLFKDRVDHLASEIHGLPKTDGTNRIYMPGEIEWEKRQHALTRGIDLPDDVTASLQALAQDLGIPFPGNRT